MQVNEQALDLWLGSYWTHRLKTSECPEDHDLGSGVRIPISGADERKRRQTANSQRVYVGFTLPCESSEKELNQREQPIFPDKIRFCKAKLPQGPPSS
jgi:hypothetical protein